MIAGRAELLYRMKRPSGDQSVGAMNPVSGRGSFSGVPSNELSPSLGQLWSVEEIDQAAGVR